MVVAGAGVDAAVSAGAEDVVSPDASTEAVSVAEPVSEGDVSSLPASAVAAATAGVEDPATYTRPATALSGPGARSREQRAEREHRPCGNCGDAWTPECQRSRWEGRPAGFGRGGDRGIGRPRPARASDRVEARRGDPRAALQAVPLVARELRAAGCAGLACSAQHRGGGVLRRSHRDHAPPWATSRCERLVTGSWASPAPSPDLHIAGTGPSHLVTGAAAHWPP